MSRIDGALHDAVILVDKPAGITSFDVIRRIRYAVSADKIGHAGTLDRFATGLLVLCTGAMTRLSRYFIEDDKEYEARIRLGVRTDTDDCEGEVIAETPVPDGTWDRIEETVSRFRGDILQVPPVYSAVKIRGRRASDMARRGHAVDLQPRRVRIDRLTVCDVDRPNGSLSISVRCSKGTYIRSIARDMGDMLGVGAHLTDLRRTASGRFNVRDAVALDEFLLPVESERRGGPHIISPKQAFDWCTEISVGKGAMWPVSNGAPFKKTDVLRTVIRDSKLSIILDEDENLIAIADIDIERWHISYLNVFLVPERGDR